MLQISQREILLNKLEPEVTQDEFDMARHMQSGKQATSFHK